jgi:hypothetical protein
MGRVRAEYWAIFWLVYVHLLFFRHSGPLLCPLEKSVGFFKPGTFLSDHIRTQPRSRGVRGRRCVLRWCVLHRPYPNAPPHPHTCQPASGFRSARGQRWRQGQPRDPNRLARRRVWDLAGVPLSGRGARGARGQTIRGSPFQPKPKPALGGSGAVTKERARCAKRLLCPHSLGPVSNGRRGVVVAGVALGGGSSGSPKVRAAVASQAKATVVSSTSFFGECS